MSQQDEYRRIEIAIALEAGKSLEAIAQEFGVATTRIRQWAQEWGMLTSPPRPKRRSGLHEADRQALLGMIREGQSLQEVAEIFEVSKAYVRQLCQKHHVLLPRAAPLSPAERNEIRELLAQGESSSELAEAYQIALVEVEALKQPDYQRLGGMVLATLFELLRSCPGTTDAWIAQQAHQQGLKEVTEADVQGYRARLKSLQML